MSRRNATHLEFDALAIEGSLLPADWLAKAASLEADHQKPSDYGVPKGLNLRDELGRYWRIAGAHWSEFRSARAQPHDAEAATQRFVTALLTQVFGAADLTLATAPQVVDEHSYPITSLALGGRLPLVVAAHDTALDARNPRFGDSGRQRSAFGLLQDYLNAADGALWGVASNGLILRLARDNASLTRPAWIEADLERIFTEDRFADFSLLWLLAHASRFGQMGAASHECALEAWREASREQGTRAREHLRLGVEEALLAFGQGFLGHPQNDALRQALASGSLAPTTYFQQLLRLVYRLIFLLTIEERGLLHPPGASGEATELYARGYSLRRLRERARRLRAYDRHHDLWQSLKPVFGGLAQGQGMLALPPLGGLFASDQCPDLDNASLGNAALLKAVFRLAWLRVDGNLARINWRDMGPEELGSVYESLLELVPEISADGRAFAFAGADQSKGNARKTSGSYYTPDDLVQVLLDSALEPVIAQRLAGASDLQAALLDITVCDPACGSGHFLLAAARRLAGHLARVRAQGTPSSEDYRHALRDVITHCIFGVDLNPMALELARMSLWLEAMTPDRPLGFLDHHLQCGDALLGVLDPAILDHGLPDEAFAVLTGDDKFVAAARRKHNRRERESWRHALGAEDLFGREQLEAKTVALERLDDDSLDALAAKRDAWRDAEVAVHESRLARLADLFVGAFLLEKTQATEQLLPSSRHLWAVANAESTAGLAEAESAARKACAESKVLHWWLAFPRVAAQGGFAVMLGNPPWEMLQLDPQEFFAADAPEIANASHMSSRSSLIAALRTERPELHHRYWSAVRAMEAVQAFAHGSGRFPKAGFGRVNLASLFAETYLQSTAIAAGGRAGVVLPSGIATDSFTQHLFSAIADGNLVSLFDMENRDKIFPAVDSRMKFCLMTLGRSLHTEFQFFATKTSDLLDARRRFLLASDDFRLLNPNTMTCPVFRSRVDAELTKSIYRSTPILIREAVVRSLGSGESEVVTKEANPWGIRFQLMFMMNTDSGLFQTAPNQRGARTLPLYEAKMIHQFDHRWATHIVVPKGGGQVETVDVTETQKVDQEYAPRPRYWVDEREVLARIARVPRTVAKAWLALHQPGDRDELSKARQTLWLTVAQWLAGELFRREAGPPQSSGAFSDGQRLYASPRVERCLGNQFKQCAVSLKAAKVTGKKAVSEFSKWATQDVDMPLSEAEIATLSGLASQGSSESRDTALREQLDLWMDRRSPRWLMGWRDITNSTNERTVISTVIGRAGVGNNLPLMLIGDVELRHAAALLGNVCSITFDFVARHKVGGTHLNYFIYKQLPVLPPDRYSNVDLDFIVPRVLELTYTAHDLSEWAADLGYSGPPFAWIPERRAKLRAELDAYFARLYGLRRDELRYILDPAAVMGEDYPSETFRGLKHNELKKFGEYRTQRLILEAWDAQTGNPGVSA